MAIHLTVACVDGKSPATLILVLVVLVSCAWAFQKPAEFSTEQTVAITPLINGVWNDCVTIA